MLWFLPSLSYIEFLQCADVLLQVSVTVRVASAAMQLKVQLVLGVLYLWWLTLDLFFFCQIKEIYVAMLPMGILSEVEEA